jgi:hypothetical protein
VAYQYVRLVQVVYSGRNQSAHRVKEEGLRMAGVAVDHYGFVHDELTPPATGLSGLSVAALWRCANHRPPRQGKCLPDFCSPAAAHPPSTTLFSGRLDPSRVAMADVVPVEINPLSQYMRWLGPRGSASRDAW